MCIGLITLKKSLNIQQKITSIEELHYSLYLGTARSTDKYKQKDNIEKLY